MEKFVLKLMNNNICIVYFQQAFSGSCLQVQKSDGYEAYFSENTEGTYGE